MIMSERQELKRVINNAMENMASDVKGAGNQIFNFFINKRDK